MGRTRTGWARQAATRVAALMALLGLNSVARAAPTILLHFEHSGCEAGVTIKDSVQFWAAGFTWSDGTVDLMREPARRTVPSHPYVASGCDSVLTSDAPAARYTLRLSGTADTVAADRPEIFDVAIPQTAEPWLRTSSESSPMTIMRLMETTFEPAVWGPEIQR